VLAHGAAGWALLLSGIPAVLCLAAGLWVFSDSFTAEKREKARVDALRAKVTQANPLVWTLMCAAGPPRYPGVPRISVEEALRAIEEPGARLNDPAPEHGTPLETALWNLGHIAVDGTELDARQTDSALLVRKLAQHGARLGEDGRASMWTSWLLRRALHEGVETARDNPLVWRIVKKEFSGLRVDDGRFLNKATPLHGTPLYAALLTDQWAVAEQLREAGARLSEQESQDPAAARVLEELAGRSGPALGGSHRTSLPDPPAVDVPHPADPK
jgi:hypothetical protein